MKSRLLAVAGTLALAFNAVAGGRPAPEGASAYIISPRHGEVVTTPFKVVFGLSGMGVAPAGMERPKTGDHHLLIDADVPDLDQPVPADDENYRQFSGGQTEVVLELTPGEHTLQLLLSDHAHVPHKPPVMSEQITILVK